MSYKELGYQFIEYFVNTINNNHQELLPAIKDDTMMTFNGDEGIGQEQIMYCFNYLQLHGLKIDAKYVLIQPMFMQNSFKMDYDGLVIFASGVINTLENGIMVNKNVHFNFVLENYNGKYYINNIMMRLSEKSRQINNYNNNQNLNNRNFNNNPHNNFNRGFGYNGGGYPMEF